MNENSKISCIEVGKYYPVPLSIRSLLGARRSKKTEKLVLAGVSFEVGAGEVFGIVGPNGAGKTTILKILSHLTSPTSGRALVCGFDVEREWEKAVRCIGYCISEERSFFWRLSGRQNLQFFADLLEVPVKVARAKINDLLELLELKEVANERFMNYSSGMKQKLAIARSLIADPQVLLMDEPTRGLDPRAASKLRSFILTYVSRQNKAAVVTTNQVSDVEHLCHRIAVLNRGRIIARGSVAEINSSLRERFRMEGALSFEDSFNLLLDEDDLRRDRAGKG
jgi:ABC-2 type transport system ATP-binding protein